MEMLIAIACLGILAALAAVSVKGWFEEAHQMEAKASIAQIAAAQEAFYAINGRYANVTNARGTSWYPATPDGSTHRAWANEAHAHWGPHGAGLPGWSELELPPGTTLTGCTTDAGLRGEDPFARGDIAGLDEAEVTAAMGPVALAPWFVVICAVDADQDGAPAVYGWASFLGSGTEKEDPALQ